jgi:hypothetical protein
MPAAQTKLAALALIREICVKAGLRFLLFKRIAAK